MQKKEQTFRCLFYRVLNLVTIVQTRADCHHSQTDWWRFANNSCLIFKHRLIVNMLHTLCECADQYNRGPDSTACILLHSKVAKRLLWNYCPAATTSRILEEFLFRCLRFWLWMCAVNINFYNLYMCVRPSFWPVYYS